MMARWRRLAVACAIAALVNMPILLVLLNSLQTTEAMLATRSVIPAVFTVSSYIFLFGHTPFLTFFANSGLIATVSTVGTLLAAGLAGYAMSRFTGWCLKIYGVALLLVQMFPIILALIPLFIIFRTLGLINNPLSVIIVYTAVHLPFATWMFRSYFDTIPRELDEAALVDGCSRLQAFFRIVLPLAGPGTAAVFSFLFSYNEFFVASVFLRDDSFMSVPVGVQMLT